MSIDYSSNPGTSDSDTKVRTCGVELSFDDTGTPHSAVARTVLYQSSPDVSYETQIAFKIEDRAARLQGFVEPSQPSKPHFETVPAACEQVQQIPLVDEVESPVETLSGYFERGRQFLTEG